MKQAITREIMRSRSQTANTGLALLEPGFCFGATTASGTSCSGMNLQLFYTNLACRGKISGVYGVVNFYSLPSTQRILELQLPGNFRETPHVQARIESYHSFSSSSDRFQPLGNVAAGASSSTCLQCEPSGER